MINETLTALYQQPIVLTTVLCLLVLWEMFWKGLALWFSAKNKQKAWFIVLLIFNTVGILAIIYLLFFKPKEKREESGKVFEVNSRFSKKTAKKKVKRK